MSLAHVPSAAPAVDRPSGVHAVGHADAPAERMAEQFSEASVAPALPLTGWSFAAVPTRGSSASAELDVRLDGDGRALDAAERLAAPPDLDARDVRVHTDAAAADTAARAGAEALTVGRRIAFAPGREQRGTEEGRRRLSHELAHAAQHRVGDPPIVRRQPKAPVTPATTLNGLPESDRKRIKVVTAFVTVPGLADKFGKSVAKTTVPMPPNTDLSVDPSAASVDQPGLRNVAATLTTTHGGLADVVLGENATITLALDLSPYGGVDGLYRFTRHVPQGAGAAARVIVEQLGKDTPPTGTQAPAATAPDQPPPPDPVAQTMTAAKLRHSFSGAPLAALRGAVAQIPAAHLAKVSGLAFVVGTVNASNPNERGKYDRLSHTITMDASAFGSNQGRFTEGAAASTDAVRAIVHEIGHALDVVTIRGAELGQAKAEEGIKDLIRRYPDGKGGYTYSGLQGDELADVRAKEKAAADAEPGLLKARSMTGGSVVKSKGNFTDAPATKLQQSAFGQAVAKDGSAVTGYGGSAPGEAFAEAYSLYITSPSVLKSLRPATSDFLEKNLPK
ncbi:DUF4157 domain-containing protein [Microbacterium sp. NPDC058062]|uniref:eCIS core domain-containing protein n=1 Tax=Microbacterium sp. NPDC058062 TaxID=3346320 RepID=UPI0036D86F44